MEINSLEAHALSSPIEPQQVRSFHGGTRTLKKRDFVLVRLETRDGEVGYAPGGASSSAMREYFADASQQRFADLLENEIGPDLRGLQVHDSDGVRTVVENHDIPTLLESQVLAAVDIALYDLKGKMHGEPVYELIGDKGATTNLDLYASAGMYMEPSGYVEQAKTIRNCGFFGYKYRPGIGPEADRKTFRGLIEDSGPMEVMVDAHTWWKTDDGAYTNESVADLVDAWAGEAYWIEEPVAPDDYAGYQRLSETGARLAGGESEDSAEGLIELARTGSVSFLQGDVRHHGGFTGCLNAVEYCNDTDIQYVPHHFGTLLGLVANAHLVAGAVDGTLLEYPVFENDPYIDASPDPGMYPFTLAFDVLNDDLDINDGQFTLPDNPGLGVEVNEDVINNYPFREGAWTEFEYEDE